MNGREKMDEYFRLEQTNGDTGSGGNPGFSVVVTIVIAVVGAIELLSNLLG